MQRNSTAFRYPTADFDMIDKHMATKGRYEILEILGEGGMGIVYRAIDPVMNREVTVKTIRDPQDKAALELFKRECAVLSSITHPNIVEIFDVGETEEAGAKRPYFVMPLLRGVTLQELIKTSSPRLTVERCVQMMSQVCRGLQAAHEHGLVHRDLKPSNLFVLPDDSVKIIDFGMAHLANHRSATGLKGTLLYMAPEQFSLKEQPTPLSDQFSLAVVCYEMLARRHPFSGAGQEDLAQAILYYTPPPISEFNPLVSPSICQVIHKALAKQPFHRFSDVRAFSDYLQKALRGEPIDIFDSSRIAPRLQQARKAFDSGDLDDAAEIVTELESENYLAPEIGELRKQIEEIRRAKTVTQLIETARRRFDEGEYVRALQKVQEVLNLDSTNTDAFTLKGAIESKRSATQIEEWFRLANQHMENHAYTHARQALEKVLDLRPKEVRAQTLLAEVERREQEHTRLRKEKQEAYQSALNAYQRGDVNSALTKLERVLDLDRRAPYITSPEQGATYQKLYEEVRSRRDQLASQEAEARRYLNDGNFPAARAICDEVLKNYPNNVLFQALRDDVEQAQRQEISAYVAKIEKEVAAEPDLNRKVSILEEASQKYPSESRFEESLQTVRSRRDLVDSIAGRARTFEESRQFSEALGLWEMLRSIYPKYPGLEIEIDRLHKRREQQAQTDAKGHRVSQIDQALTVHNYAKATSLAADALVEFPGDPELSALARQAQHAQTRALEAVEKTNRGKELHAAGNIKEALALLREAFQLDAHNPVVRTGLVETLLKEASELIDGSWRAAEPLVQEGLELDPSNPLAKSLDTLIQDKRQAEEVSAALSRARELQAQGNIKDAIIELDKARITYPRENRLIQFRSLLQEGLSAKDRDEIRARDLEEVKELARQSKETKDVPQLDSIFQRTGAFSKYGADADFRQPLSEIEERLRNEKETTQPPAAEVKPLAPPPVPAKRPASKKRWSAIFHRPIPTAVWPIVGFSIVALALLFGRRALLKHPPPPTRLPTVQVAFQVQPEGAEISVDKELLAGTTKNLAPGPHTVTVRKTGYTPIVEQPFHVDREHSRVERILAPEPHVIQILAEPRVWKVVLDDMEKGTLQDGDVRFDLPGGGTHTLKVLDGKNPVFSIEFQADRGEPARIGTLSAGDIPVTVVSSLGSRARVYSSVPAMRALKDGELQAIPPEGLELQPVNNEVTFADGKKPQSVPVDTNNNAPVLTVRAGSVPKGTLVITANVDGAHVIIDGKESSSRVQGGWTQSLEPGEHRVQLRLNGYDDTDEQKVTIGAGKKQSVPFELKLSETMAFLRVEGGTSGAEVWLDGERFGNLDSSGSFERRVNAGVDHTIQFKKENFEPSNAHKRQAAAKRTIQFSESDAKLKPFGTLVFTEVNPSETQITIQRGSDTPQKVTDTTLPLYRQEGTYLVRGTADQHLPFEQEAQVLSGKPTDLPVRLKRTQARTETNTPPPLKPKPVELRDLFDVDPKSWTRDDRGFWIHNGPAPIKDMVPFSHVFDVFGIRKGFLGVGVEKFRWKIYLQGEDYREFELDESNLHWKEVRGGKPGKWTQLKPHRAGKKDFYPLAITIESDQVTYSIGELTDTVRGKRMEFFGKFGLRLEK